MNKTFEIVKAWASFEEKFPEGNIDDFCRLYLAQQKNAKAKEAVCNDCDAHFDLSRVINQLSRLWMYFTQTAIRPFELSSFDEFVFLYTVDAVVEVKKKDLIYLHFIEISSGLLIIDRLLKKGLLKEAVDEKDKRSKLLTITKKGQKVLAKSRAEINKVAEEMYDGMSNDDMFLCVQLLLPIQKKNAQKWHQLKKFEPNKL